MELHKVMGDLIVQHRFSKRQICETLGITRVTLNSYLSGSVSPSVDLLVKFLNLFDIHKFKKRPRKVRLSQRHPGCINSKDTKIIHRPY